MYVLKLDTTIQPVDYDYHLPNEDLTSPAAYSPVPSFKLENHSGYPQHIIVLYPIAGQVSESLYKTRLRRSMKTRGGLRTDRTGQDWIPKNKWRMTRHLERDAEAQRGLITCATGRSCQNIRPMARGFLTVRRWLEYNKKPWWLYHDDSFFLYTPLLRFFNTDPPALQIY
jgi:hypothetical protein